MLKIQSAEYEKKINLQKDSTQYSPISLTRFTANKNELYSQVKIIMIYNLAMAILVMIFVGLVIHLYNPQSVCKNCSSNNIQLTNNFEKKNEKVGQKLNEDLYEEIDDNGGLKREPLYEEIQRSLNIA